VPRKGSGASPVPLEPCAEACPANLRPAAAQGISGPLFAHSTPASTQLRARIVRTGTSRLLSFSVVHLSTQDNYLFKRASWELKSRALLLRRWCLSGLRTRAFFGGQRLFSYGNLLLRSSSHGGHRSYSLNATGRVRPGRLRTLLHSNEFGRSFTYLPCPYWPCHQAASHPIHQHALSYSARFCVGDARCVQSGG
jgi:hypothetical protein